MKKKVSFILYSIIIFILFTNPASAKGEVEFAKCVDGDTIRVILEGKEEIVRFLAVDTPETKHPQKGEEPFGKEASKYTCDSVKNAKTLKIEYDPSSDERDNYNRVLAWIWVDDSLLQASLIEKGYAKVAYLYGDYIYTDALLELEATAKTNKVGIWGDYVEEETSWIYIIIAIISIILILIFMPKERKRLASKAKRNVRKKINKNIDNLFK